MSCLGRSVGFNVRWREPKYLAALSIARYCREVPELNVIDNTFVVVLGIGWIKPPRIHSLLVTGSMTAE